MSDIQDSLQYAPAYFEKLSLKNVRAFGPTSELELRNVGGQVDRWTLIVGENGTGKSSILEALNSLVYLANTFSASDISGSFSTSRGDVPPFVEERSPHLIHLLKLGTSDELSIQADYVASFNSHAKSKEFHEISIQKQAERPRFSVGYVPHGWLMFCAPYTASRKVSRSGLDTEDEYLNLPQFLSVNAQPVRSPLDPLLQLSHVEALGSTGRFTFVHASNIIRKLLPQVSNVRVGIRPEASVIRAEVQFEVDGQWILAEQSGYGYLSTLAWVLDLAFKLVEAFPDIEDPLQAPAVCLVDEIDLHLHPMWQRTIVKTLLNTFPNVQFIVTAHSPIMVQASAGHNIVLLRRNEQTGFVDIVNDVDEIANWRLDQILTSELFGLDSARPSEQAALMRERIDILSKPELDEKDHARLANLQEALKDQPRGETADEVRLNSVLDAAIDRLTRSSRQP